MVRGFFVYPRRDKAPRSSRLPLRRGVAAPPPLNKGEASSLQRETAFIARRPPAPSFVPHRAAIVRRLGQASYSAPSQQQAVQFACCGAGYLRACVALKPSGGAGLSKGQRGNIRKFPLAPWKTTPLQKPSSFLHALWLMQLIPLPMCSENTV